MESPRYQPRRSSDPVLLGYQDHSAATNDTRPISASSGVPASPRSRDELAGPDSSVDTP